MNKLIILLSAILLTGCSQQTIEERNHEIIKNTKLCEENKLKPHAFRNINGEIVVVCVPHDFKEEQDTKE